MVNHAHLLFCLTVLTTNLCQGQNTPPSGRLYNPPMQVEDGWRVAKAADAGLSVDSLNVLLRLIESTPPQDFRSLTIARDGRLVVDAYFNSYNRTTLHDIRSATKSITALLTGIALDRGLIHSIHDPLFKLFEEGAGYIALDPGKIQITLEDALTMRSALDADANDVDSPGNEINWLDSERDWLEFNLSLPMTNGTPGENYVYNSTNAFLTGAMIEQAAGIPLHEFAEKHLFSPLGITDFYWSTGPGGYTAGMGNLYLTNRALAKIGQVVLDSGLWGKTRIVSAEWIDEMTRKHVDLPGPFMDTHGYGYLWYTGTKIVNGAPVNYVFASGNGGNVIYISPQLDLVVAMSSSAYGTPHGNFRSNVIFERILHAVQNW